MRRLLLFVPVALLIAGFSVGCGSSNDSPDTPAPPTKAEFIKKADAICGKANSRIQAGLSKAVGAGKPSQKQVIALTRSVIIPGLEAQLKAIRKLPPPEEGVDELDTFAANFSHDIDALKKDPASSANQKIMANSMTAATTFGFNNCGTNGTA